MAESAVTKKLGANPTRKEILANWTPEDPVFWKKFGERIAKQNLYTSTWALVLSFVVWTLWATITAKLNMAGFHFSDEQLFTLAALPGLVGATGRLFYTYLPGLIGLHHDGPAALPALRPRPRTAGPDDVLRHIRPARLLHRHRRRQLLRLDGQHRLLLPEGA